MKKLIISLLLLMTAVPAMADYQTGERALKNRDYSTALKEFKPLARKGNGRAQYAIGFMYENGYGVPKNQLKAVEWYQAAANKGIVAAMSNLAAMYSNGNGFTVDQREALKWRAMSYITMDYKKSNDLMATPLNVLRWLQKTAATGNAHAMAGMGEVYERGLFGQPVNLDLAEDWYTKSNKARSQQ